MKENFIKIKAMSNFPYNFVNHKKSNKMYFNLCWTIFPTLLKKYGSILNINGVEINYTKLSSLRMISYHDHYWVKQGNCFVIADLNVQKRQRVNNKINHILNNSKVIGLLKCIFF